ncbi:MAG: tetratricopeptide repeat protein [Pseudomonadota bacterium]
MTHHDVTGCPVHLPSADAVAHWDGVIHGFLSHGTQTPVHLGEVLEAAPDFALGHAAKGLFSLMMGRAELIAPARAALASARNAPHPDQRTALWVRALEAWLGGSPKGAIAAMEEVLARHPTDTLSAKVSHAIRFILGDARGMRASIEAVMPAHEGHALRGYLLGCHAFTLEETGDYDAAERAGREGLALAPDDAWGLHAVAHVFDMTARPGMGIALIEENCAAWDHCNNFRTHVWWHKALLHLDRGEVDTALALYDDEIRADKTDDYRDIANATSLLMRLELEGRDVGARWEELAALAANRVDDGCLVFADLHYMLALSGAGRDTDREAIVLRTATDATRPGEMNAIKQRPGLCAMAGLEAFAENRWDQAFQNLASARPYMQTIGGSHAQRDVFERMTIDAGLRAGRLDRTEAILAERTALRAGKQDRFAATRAEAIANARAIAAE